MKKSIRIWENRLEISKEGLNYMISDEGSNLFIHADKLELSYYDRQKGWLILKCADEYIGSIWINNDTNMKKIKKFLEETK